MNGYKLFFPISKRLYMKNSYLSLFLLLINVGLHAMEMEMKQVSSPKIQSKKVLDLDATIEEYV